MRYVQNKIGNLHKIVIRGRDYNKITSTLHMAHTKSIIGGLLIYYVALDTCLPFPKQLSERDYRQNS